MFTHAKQFVDESINRTIIRCINIVQLIFFFQAEDGIRDVAVTGVQTCALPIFSLAGAAVLLVSFVRYERWKTDRDGSPLLMLSLFHHRSFVVGLGVGLTFFSVLAPFLVLLTEYLQSGLDLTPRAAGLRFLPFAISFLSASFASARLAPCLGRAILQLGAGLMVTGLLSLMAVVRSAALSTYPLAYILPLLLYGFGQGSLQEPLVNFILADVPPDEAGSASGVGTLVPQLALALGVAALARTFAWGR